uniref:WAP domain-containing protein n=1 Tax=Meloidogyne javanica TaxID=6303 RepID=A0A915N0X0_MELJA
MSKSANRLISHLTNSSVESAPDGGNLPSNPPSPPLDPSILRQQPPSTTSSLAYPTKFRASVPAISIEKDENLHEGGREDVINFMDNKSTTAATADELMQMLMEDDGTDRPIIFTVFEAANIDGVRHLSSKSRCTRTPINIYIILFSTFFIFQLIDGNQEQCIGIGGKCDVDTDCCGDRNIRCVGAWEPTKKPGKCQKTCDLDGAPCGKCCNYCDSKTKKCSSIDNHF